MLQKAYSKDCLSNIQMFMCHNAFNDGIDNVDAEHSIGRKPRSWTSNNMAKIKAFFYSDCRLSVGMNADSLHLTKSIVPQIATEKLRMLKICAKLLTRILTDGEK